MPKPSASPLPDPSRAEISGEFTRAHIEALAARGDLTQLSLRRDTPLTEPVAPGLAALASVEDCWLGCNATRAALRHVLALPRLRELQVFGLATPGRLAGTVAAATHLEVFRASWLTESDLLSLARSHTLRELWSHGAKITPRVVDAFAAMPRLESLDIEDCRFDDAMAERLAVSTTITSLWVCNTRLTGRGLAALCRMRQLRELDLWMTQITADDLSLLATLPALTKVTLGSYNGDPDALRGKDVVPALRKIRKLKTVWLDGVVLSASQRRAIEKRYPEVRIN
jgi:hypothetical protein